MFLIPFISAYLYLAGGQWNKRYRWLMGVPIAIIGVCCHQYWAVLAIPAYWIATSAFPYGENSWLNFLGEYGKFIVCGVVFGACSFTMLHWYLGVLQMVVAGLCWWFIKVLDEQGIIGNPYVELLRGFTGTMIYFAGGLC